MFPAVYSSLFDRMLDWSRQVDEIMNERLSTAWSDTPTRAQIWLPAVDLYETDTNFVLSAELPGVHQENVDIQFDRGTLTISGTRGPTLPVTKEKGQLRVYTSERLSGSFSRSIRLPEHVDGERIEANFADGVLTVTIPKAAGALPRKITIRPGEQAKQLKA